MNLITKKVITHSNQAARGELHTYLTYTNTHSKPESKGTPPR